MEEEETSRRALVHANWVKDLIDEREEEEGESGRPRQTQLL